MKLCCKLLSISIFLLCLSASASWAGPDKAKPDSLIMVVGKVIDAQTQLPVKAQVVYEMKPYAQMMGVADADQQNGNFTFYLPPKTQFTVTVSSAGFMPYTQEIEVADYKDQQNIELNVALQPSGIDRVLRLNVNFEEGKFALKEESYSELETLVKSMRENSKMRIQLEGHTDYRGSSVRNMELSENRVKAVKNYLTNQGIKALKDKDQSLWGHPAYST